MDRKIPPRRTLVLRQSDRTKVPGVSCWWLFLFPGRMSTKKTFACNKTDAQGGPNSCRCRKKKKKRGKGGALLCASLENDKGGLSQQVTTFLIDTIHHREDFTWRCSTIFSTRPRSWKINLHLLPPQTRRSEEGGWEENRWNTCPLEWPK